MIPSYYNHIATLYGRVADAHREIAQAARIAGRPQESRYHTQQENKAYTLAHEYSMLALECRNGSGEGGASC